MPDVDKENLIQALRSALKENERLRREHLRAAGGPVHEPIAVIGMGCRYPGGIRRPADLWRVVDSGTDAIGPYPCDRGWSPEPSGLDEGPVGFKREGGFIQAELFDPGFFGIAPAEAMAMKPEQRLMLETAWETLEDAGIPPTDLSGSRTGVFTGLMAWFDRLRIPAGIREHALLGRLNSVIPGRIAYALSFEGPAITIDTACSSAFTAMHLASNALRSGECTLALVGGAHVITSTEMFGELRRHNSLAPDGRSKSFAAAADGTGWGEGVGMVLLERLSEAQRNGHRILALIRGTGISQSGTSNGMTAPSSAAQQRVIRMALANAGLTADQIDHVEAHGTGTRIGDPIEAHALSETYGRSREPGRPLWIGSIKSNLGHTQAAGSIAGLIKVIMSMRHRTLPRTLHIDRPSPHIDWDHANLAVLEDSIEWPNTGQPFRAGVHSLGISGSNAHVIVEAAPDDNRADGTRPDHSFPPIVPWAISAKSEPALRDQARKLSEHLREHPWVALADVGYSLAMTRSHFGHRAAVIAGDRAECVRALTALAEGVPDPRLLRKDVAAQDGGQGWTSRVHAVASAFVHGERADWAAIYDGSGARFTDLPTYAFQHQQYWLSPEDSEASGA